MLLPVRADDQAGVGLGAHLDAAEHKLGAILDRVQAAISSCAEGRALPLPPLRIHFVAAQPQAGDGLGAAVAQQLAECGISVQSVCRGVAGK